ncbi:MAG TPA: GvpL/GvpF family gas vesicle protein [Thermoanaerobaculia bacterium]|nr:GvpL/GvpF family gas vesicle protein [Thermoanaerobaculia bacterium]
MPTTGRYIYGLIRANEDKDYGCIGLEHDGGPGRVFTVRAGAVAAVVSEYPVRQKVLPLRKNLDPHHRVIREAMMSTTIIPMTFGHVAKSEDEVVRTLRRNLDEIRTELDRVDGKVEMGLKVNWDVDNIFEYFVATDQELAALRDQLFGRSHAPSQAEMIELGRRFEECLEREREEQTERVVEAFRSCFSEVTVNPPKNQKGVMDIAFLVERERTKDFEERVNQVAGTFPAQYLFDYGGPWAPFNFTELDLRNAAG